MWGWFCTWLPWPSFFFDDGFSYSWADEVWVKASHCLSPDLVKCRENRPARPSKRDWICLVENPVKYLLSIRHRPQEAWAVCPSQRHEGMYNYNRCYSLGCASCRSQIPTALLSPFLDHLRSGRVQLQGWSATEPSQVKWDISTARMLWMGAGESF